MTANLNFLATFILVALMLPSGAFGQVPPAVTGETVVVMTHPPDPLERRQTTTDETVVVRTRPRSTRQTRRKALGPRRSGR
jgi:hypothetical protein